MVGGIADGSPTTALTSPNGPRRLNTRPRDRVEIGRIDRPVGAVEGCVRRVNYNGLLAVGSDMGVKDKVEACGRCSMTAVVDVMEGTSPNPFDGDRIEVSDAELRAVSRHVVLLGKLKDRLNRWSMERIYGDLGR